MKYFGRLFGRAPTALVDVSPSNNTSPYTASLPGSKMMSQGEGSSAAAHNRALGALEENIEYITDILDSPALAESRIVANTSAAFGSAALHNTSLTASPAILDLGDITAGFTPVHWVYVGLHQSELGKFIRAYRYDLIGDVTTAAVKQRGLDVYDQLNPTDALHMNSAAPTQVYHRSGGTAFWNFSQAYATAQTTISPHAISPRIPGISQVKTHLAPYSNSLVAQAIGSWAQDGCYLSGTIGGLPATWQRLYVQSGVFVHIEGAGTNNGLYRVAQVTTGTTAASSKAVLTRGGLYKVTVDSTAGFSLGNAVNWKSPPNGAAGGAGDARENVAYVMFIENATTMYLGQIGSEGDLPYNGTVIGRKVSDGNSFNTGLGVGQLGLLDQESGATDNWNISIGTRIYFIMNGANPDYASVTAVIPPGYPVLFDTTQTGTATPCSPPGFLLNPSLTFADGSLTGGQYTVQCKTLSTVREQLKAQGAGANKLIQNAASRLGYNEFEAGMVRAFARYVKTGDENFGIRSGGASNPVEYPAGPFTGTNTLLGEALWKITFTGATTLAASLALENGGVYIGQPCSFVSATASVGGGFAVTTAKWVAVTGQVAIVSDVATSSWTPRDIATNAVPVGYSPLPITTNATVTTADAAVHTVSVINYAPVIQQSDNVSPLYPSQGLEAAYNNHYAAAKTARGNGLGNQILMQNSRPITAVLINGYNATTGAFRVSTISTAAAYTLIDCVARDTDTSVANVAVQAGGVLSFGDANKSIVPLTTAVTGVEFPTNYATAVSTGWLAPVAHTSILTSLNRINDEQPVKVPVRVATVTTNELSTSNYAANAGVSTLTKTANGVVTIDGVAIVLGDRVLIRHGSAGTGFDGTAFGIYKCTTEGAVGAAAVFTRANDANSVAKLYPGVQVEVTAGTQAGLVYCLNTTGPINPDFATTGFSWKQQGGLPTSTAATTIDGSVAPATAGGSKELARADHTHNTALKVRILTGDANDNNNQILFSDHVIIARAIGSDIEIYLPVGQEGHCLKLRKMYSNDATDRQVTFTCDGSELFDGGANTVVLSNVNPNAELVWHEDKWYNLVKMV